MKRAAIVACVACAGSVPLLGSDKTPTPAPAIRYEYVHSVIRSLEQADKAMNRFTATAKTQAQDTGAMMAANRILAAEIRVATGSLEEYSTSSDEPVRESSKGVRTAYDWVTSALDTSLDLYGKLMTAKTIEDLAELRKANATIAGQMDQAWALLRDAVKVVSLCLVVPDPQDKEKIALTVSVQEHAQLLKMLTDAFGARVKKPDNGPSGAAALLFAELNQRWRHARAGSPSIP